MTVSSYPAESTTALSTGCGLGSLIAGMLAILQGSVEGFSVMSYYLILSSLYIPAFVALYFISKDSIYQTNPSHEFDIVLNDESESKFSILPSSDDNLFQKEKEKTFISDNMSTLFLLSVNAFLGYGLVPSLISLACGKFKHKTTVLLYATSLAAIVGKY